MDSQSSHSSEERLKSTMHLYTVELEDRTFQILSQDDEQAAFYALELATEANQRLINVSPFNETE